MIDESYLPAEYDTGVYRGDTFSQAFTFTTGGVPIDLVGSEPRVQIRTKAGELLDDFALGDGLTVGTNTLYWTIDSARSEGYALGKYKYDVEVLIGTMKRTYLAGSFVVSKDITVPEL